MRLFSTALFLFTELELLIRNDFTATKSLVIRLGKWAAFADALVVHRSVAAYDLRLLHLDAKVLFYKINGGQDG